MNTSAWRTLNYVIGGAALCCSAVAFVWGGDVSKSREIYADQLSIRMADGKLGVGIVTISVTATTYVGQRGNAKWPDNRACYHDAIRLTLVRSLTLTMPDGTSIPVRDTTVALPDQGGRSWGAVTTCNDKIGEIESSLISAAGNAEKWRTYIDGQRAEVRKVVEQFGQVV